MSLNEFEYLEVYDFSAALPQTQNSDPAFMSNELNNGYERQLETAPPSAPVLMPEPVCYTNVLELSDYMVEIIGGKHFTTPHGEFVEVKSGTQYKIHVVNMYDEGRCNILKYPQIYFKYPQYKSLSE